MESLKMSSGRTMPVIGFGTWQLSRQEALQGVKAALEAGYRHIDTAKLYGNEAEVGQAVRGSGIPREQVFVTTKLWNSDQGYESALKAFDASLDRLGLEYVDLYLIHWPGYDRPSRLDSWKALKEIEASGRAKTVGVSNFTVGHLRELKENTGDTPAVNQIEFHPFIYDEQRELLEYCEQAGIVFEAYSPLARGRLTDRRLAEIGAHYGKSVSQIMIRWALQHGTVPLPRSSSRQHIKQNFDVFDFEISPPDMKEIDNL